MQVPHRKLETQVQAIAGELFHGQILLTSSSINEALGVNLLEKTCSLPQQCNKAQGNPWALLNMVEMGGIEPPSDIWILTLLRV